MIVSRISMLRIMGSFYTTANLEIVFVLSYLKSDEDFVNMVALYFINNYLFFKDKGKLVDDVDV